MLEWMRKYAAWIVLGTIATFVLSIGFLQLPAMFDSSRSKPTGQLATINGREIDSKRFVQSIRSIQAQSGIQSEADRVGPWIELMLQYQAMRSTLESEIQLMEARKQRVKVSGQELKQQMEAMSKQYGYKNLDEFKQAVSKSGQKWGEIERLVREDMMIYKLREKIVSHAVVNEQVLKDRYKKVIARHILLLSKPGIKDSDLKNKIQEIKKKALKNPESFAALAQQYSEDPGSSKQGGLLPEFGVGQMVPEFEQLAFALKPGEIGGPVKTDYGYHLIKLESLKDPGIPLDVDLKKLKTETEQSLQSKEFMKFNQYLVREYKTEIFHPLLKAVDNLQRGNREAAILSFFQAQAQFPGIDGMIFAAQAFQLQGKTKEAEAQFQKALFYEKKLLKKTDPILHYHYGVFLAENKQLDKAKREWSTAIQNGSGNLALLHFMQMAYQRFGLNAEAKTTEARIQALQALRQGKQNQDLDQLLKKVENEKK